MPLDEFHPLNRFLELAATDPIPAMQLPVSASIINKMYDPNTPAAFRWKQIEAMLGLLPQGVKDIGLDQPPEYVPESAPVVTEIKTDTVIPSLEKVPPPDGPGWDYKQRPPVEHEITGLVEEILDDIASESKGG